MHTDLLAHFSFTHSQHPLNRQLLSFSLSTQLPHLFFGLHFFLLKFHAQHAFSSLVHASRVKLSLQDFLQGLSIHTSSEKSQSQQLVRLHFLLPLIEPHVEGDFVGAEVGDFVSAEVGDVVGAEVGDSVGAEVGDVVGAEVGDVVGAEVGDVVGAEVGDVVGAEVGDVVGAEVGDFVGDDDVWVVQPSSSNSQA